MHMLRRSFATHLLPRKTDIRVVQVLFELRFVETTLRDKIPIVRPRGPASESLYKSGLKHSGQ